MLDAEEYLHLALHASSAGNHHACMTYLKEVLLQQPRHPTAIYLLAVQHAELGLFERAVSGMIAAIAIEPRLEIARFQLGLLLIDRNRRPEAREHFAALGGSADDELRVYAEAMVALADDNLRIAREKLALGLSRERRNPALSALMRRLLDNLSTPDEAAVSKTGVEDSEMFLGAYRQT